MEPKKFTFEDFKNNIQILSRDHDLSDFCCDFEDELGVNEFIHVEAFNYQNMNLGITYLFFHREKCLGFITLSMGSINLEELTEEEARKMGAKPFNHFPALLIGQIGTHNDFRERHIGTIMVNYALGMADRMCEEIGCRYLSLVTTQSKITIYTRMGFEVKNSGKKRIVMAQRVR